MSGVEPEKGEKLKQVRESKGITLESVHDATKIPMDALRAIEEGYTVRTLSSFYYRGFLKIYAKYLNLDVKDFVDDVREPTRPEPIKSSMEEQDVQEMVTSFFTDERKQIVMKVVGVIIILFVFFKFVGFVKGIFTPKAKAVASSQSKEKTPTRSSRQSPAVRTVASTDAKTSRTVNKSSTAAKEITLTIRAKKNSWLQVRTDGNVVFQSTLKKGVAETWTANEKIELSGKNINLLEFELNGKMIGSLGRGERGARRLVVTKEGLSVKR